MCIRDIAAKLIDIAFPHTQATPRASLADELLLGRHVPLPAIYDDILRSISGRTLFAYRDEHVRAAIKSLKYDGNADVTAWFGTQACDTIADIIALSGTRKLLVIPIPVTFSRHLERGYNQSALIARAILKFFPNKINYDETVLVRSEFAQSQTKARTRSERSKNIVGAFEVIEPERIAGRDILIIDDVITTGATIREAARVVRAAGAHSVSCFALAH